MRFPILLALQYLPQPDDSTCRYLMDQSMHYTYMDDANGQQHDASHGRSTQKSMNLPLLASDDGVLATRLIACHEAGWVSPNSAFRNEWHSSGKP